MAVRYVSQLFQPVITIPKNAIIKNTEITSKSQKLLLECGLIRPTSSGLFTFLPLARRALDKLENLVRSYVEDIGGQRISLPALTAANLWEKTGRLADVGPELIKVDDRHGKKYLLAPTHEEAIADLLSDVGPLSYRQLPLLLYQISNKYRDEHRPKHGLMRSREFSMLDAYSAHEDDACAQRLYARIEIAYRALFNRLGLDVRQVDAPTGEMGGTLSHEWQLPSPAGEDEVAACRRCGGGQRGGGECRQCGGEVEVVGSIEVGHTFLLGSRYSDPLQALCVPAAGAPRPLVMGCYGIGLSRLLAASIEVLSTEKALRWPRAIAPYSVLVIGPKEGSKEWSSRGWAEIPELYRGATALHGDILIDDRHHLTIGKRLLMGDRMGYPTIVVCGKSTLESPPRYEVYRPASPTGAPELVTLGELMRLLNNPYEDYDALETMEEEDY